MRQTKLTFELDFPGNLCLAAFVRCLKTSLPRLVRISFQFQEPTEMIKKFLTTQKFSLLTVCTLPWQDKINRLDGTAASAVCCIMHKKHKKENEKYLLNEILQLSVTKKNLARIAALHK